MGLIELTDGIDNGVLTSGTYANIKPQVHYVDGDPTVYANGVVLSLTGSDICYDISTGSFCIGDITNGVGGSVWLALRTV